MALIEPSRGGYMARYRAIASVLKIFVLVTMIALLASGQDYRAKLQGVVTDPTQAVVAGAKVTLTNVNTGISAVKETGPDGHYIFDLVDPGTYAVTVEAIGFQSFRQEDVLVQVRADVT